MDTSAEGITLKHTGCGGIVRSDPTTTYEYALTEFEDGPTEVIEAPRCTKCGREITGNDQVYFEDPALDEQ